MDRIDRYKITSLVTESVEAVTYCGLDEQLNRKLLLTVQVAPDKARAEALLAALSEVSLSIGMSHPNLVVAHDWGIHPEFVYAAADYPEGRNLMQMLIGKERIDLVEALSYMVQCAHALQSVHAKGITHSHLTPSSILIGPDGVLKIVGLGMRGAVGGNHPTKLGPLSLALAYKAPEQFEGISTAGSDIFSFGVIAFYLATGEHPFWKSNVSNPGIIVRNIANATLVRDIGSECPSPLRDVILRCLKKTAEERYQSLEEIQRDLEPISSSLEKEWVDQSLMDCERLFDRGMKEEALDLLRRLKRRVPSNNGVNDIARKMTETSQSAGARERCEKLLQVGHDALERNDYLRAIENFEAALERDAFSLDALIALEDTRRMQRNLERLDAFLETGLYEAAARDIPKATRTADLLLGGMASHLSASKFVYPPAAKLTRLLETIGAISVG